jgi:hypothetical protein
MQKPKHLHGVVGYDDGLRIGYPYEKKQENAGDELHGSPH